MRFRPLPVMTLCVLVSLVILAMLGNWQWQRYGEKTEAETTQIAWQPLGGVAVSEEVFFVSTIVNGRSAWKHVGAYRDTQTDQIVLATHFISFGINPPGALSLQLGEKFVSQQGVFLIPAKPGAFTSKPAGGTFHAYDVEGMRARLPDQLGADVSDEIYEPRLVSVRDDAGDTGEIQNPFADPALADPLPPARHLGYALTWWGIALGLIVIYLAYHMSVGRLSFGKRV